MKNKVSIREFHQELIGCNEDLTKLPFEIKSKENTIRVRGCGALVLNTGFADKVRDYEGLEILFNPEKSILFLVPSFSYYPGQKKISKKDRERKTQITCNINPLISKLGLDLQSIKGKYVPFSASFTDGGGYWRKGWAINLKGE